MEYDLSSGSGRLYLVMVVADCLQIEFDCMVVHYMQIELELVLSIH